MIDEEIIIEIYDSRRGETQDSATDAREFGPQDLVGSRIVGTRTIKTNGENPENLRVYDLEGGRALVFGIEGFGDEYDIHAFLVHPDGSERYTDGYELISPDR